VVTECPTYFKPLKPEERKREREREEKVGGGVRHYIKKGRVRAKFTAMKVPRQ
jgi:hypothetical protein